MERRRPLVIRAVILGTHNASRGHLSKPSRTMLQWHLQYCIGEGGQKLGGLPHPREGKTSVQSKRQIDAFRSLANPLDVFCWKVHLDSHRWNLGSLWRAVVIHTLQSKPRKKAKTKRGGSSKKAGWPSSARLEACNRLPTAA